MNNVKIQAPVKWTVDINTLKDGTLVTNEHCEGEIYVVSRYKEGVMAVGLKEGGWLGPHTPVTVLPKGTIVEIRTEE